MFGDKFLFYSRNEAAVTMCPPCHVPKVLQPRRSTAVLEQTLKRWPPRHAPSVLTCPSICHHPAPQPSFLWKFYLGEQMAPPHPSVTLKHRAPGFDLDVNMISLSHFLSKLDQVHLACRTQLRDVFRRGKNGKTWEF